MPHRNMFAARKTQETALHICNASPQVFSHRTETSNNSSRATKKVNPINVTNFPATTCSANNAETPHRNGSRRRQNPPSHVSSHRQTSDMFQALSDIRDREVSMNTKARKQLSPPSLSLLHQVGNTHGAETETKSKTKRPFCALSEKDPRVPHNKQQRR